MERRNFNRLSREEADVLRRAVSFLAGHEFLHDDIESRVVPECTEPAPKEPTNAQEAQTVLREYLLVV